MQRPPQTISDDDDEMASAKQAETQRLLAKARPPRDAMRLSPFAVYATALLASLGLHTSITNYRISRLVAGNQAIGVRARLRSSAFLQAEIAVVTLHAGWSGYDWADCSFSRPKRDYCRRHGYLLLDERHYAPEDALPLHWWMYPQAARFRKLQYLEQLLRARLPCRYFFWLDGDALFVDQNRSLEAQLTVVRQTVGPNATDDPVFVLVASHKRYGLNNGVWLVQNSLLAHAAVLDMYNKLVALGSHVADQLSVARYYREHGDFVRESTWLVARRKRVRAAAVLGGADEPAPFILHLPGKTMEQRRERLREKSETHLKAKRRKKKTEVKTKGDKARDIDPFFL
eukprot:g59020.t1